VERLKKKLRKNGYDYTQLHRGEKACLYELNYAKNVKYYEVFLIKVRKQRTVANKTFPKAEVFPHDEAFGYWAWVSRNYSKMKAKFDQIESVEDIGHV